MTMLKKEAEFFAEIANEVRKLVQSFHGTAAIAKHKKLEGDYSTEVDLAVENLIVVKLQKWFPEDEIMAEEGHAETAIPEGRLWVIDPICGTGNLGRGIKNFCTNIALVDSRKPIAACVVDHSQDDYFWSVGDGKVYVNDQPLQPSSERLDTFIDVDLGSLPNVDRALQRQLIQAADSLVAQPGFALVSLDSSLSFAYTAVGKLDGFINSFTHLWDMCAASFLIEQAGGVMTDLYGNAWTVSSKGAIAARNVTLHAKLLDVYVGAKNEASSL